MIATIQDIIQLTKDLQADFAEVRLGSYQTTEFTLQERTKKWIHTEQRIETSLSIWQGGILGQSYVTDITEASITSLVVNAAESTGVMKNLSGTSPDRVKHEKFLEKGDLKPDESKILVRDKLEFARVLRRAVKRESPEIDVSIHYMDREGEWFFANSDGYQVKTPVSEFSLEISAKVTYALKTITRMHYHGGRLVKSHLNPETANRIGKRISKRLLSARIVTPPPKKRMDIIVDPVLSGMIIHEICHGIEGDLVMTKNPWKKKLGGKIPTSLLTIYDVPNARDYIVHYTHDAEGFPAEKTTIIDEGVIKNFICDSRTGKALKCATSQNARAVHYDSQHFPVSSNLVVDTGDVSIEAMIRNTEAGIFCQGYVSVSVNWDENEMTIVPEQALLVSNGDIRHEHNLAVKIKENVDDLLRKLDQVGNRRGLSAIMCQKGGGLLSGSVCPAMLFKRVKVLEN
ncbi:MAG: TldD/PmbA family protein [Candidatus Odinarchaeota archaeon]